MTQGTNPVQPMTIELNAEMFREIAKLRDWKTNTDIAKAVGVSTSQVRRILSGEQEPTVRFIAGLLHYSRIAGFRRTFNLVPATDTNEEVTTT